MRVALPLVALSLMVIAGCTTQPRETASGPLPAKDTYYVPPPKSLDGACNAGGDGKDGNQTCSHTVIIYRSASAAFDPFAGGVFASTAVRSLAHKVGPRR